MLGNRVNDLEDAARDPGQDARRARIREQPAASRPTRPPNAPMQGPARRDRDDVERRQFAGDREPARREGRARGAAARRPRRARQAAARHQRDPAAGRKLLGRPSAWRTRCCASASTTSPPKSPSSRCSSKARIRRSRRCWPRNRRRRRFRPSPANDSRSRARARRRRRHARRAHPRAAVARLPRPPAGGVIPGRLWLDTAASDSVNRSA